MSEADQPKIIIDDDWKAQAQAEKAKLAEQEQAKQAAPATGEAPADGPGVAQSGPIGFTDLVQVLASQALMYMGAVPDPQTGKAMVSPPLAKAHIDMLGVIEDKTKGNLSDEESKLLTGILYELRMQYVELSKAVEQAIREGKISTAQAGEIGLGGAAASSSPPSPSSTNLGGEVK